MMTVGIDLVRVSRVAESLAQFGERFLKRVFTDGEIAYATASPAMAAERLAARFAAKEAAFKALGFIDGGSWRQIEVTRQASGRCELSLHGAARDAAANAGVTGIAVSLSHEGDYATAVVVAMRNQEAA
jgi:holo-[acyl-carrier protein] synthase